MIPRLEFPSVTEATTYATNAFDAEYTRCGLSLFERRIAPMPDIGSAVRIVLIAHLLQNGRTRQECEIMIVNVPDEDIDRITAEIANESEHGTTHIAIVLAMSNKIIAYWNSLPENS